RWSARSCHLDGFPRVAQPALAIEAAAREETMPKPLLLGMARGWTQSIPLIAIVPLLHAVVPRQALAVPAGGVPVSGIARSQGGFLRAGQALLVPAAHLPLYTVGMSGPPSAVGSVPLDAAGRFQIDRVAPGTWFLLLAAPEHSPLLVPLWIEPEDKAP